MNESGHRLLWPTVILAFALWFVTFSLPGAGFWIKISLSAGILAALALRAGTAADNRLAFDRAAVFQGLLSAALLYGIFWFGNEISWLIFPFAPQQVAAIYAKGAGFPLPVVFLLLLLVTGPCEEIYWRGFLQRNLMLRYGEIRGWILATAIYAGVHILSFNLMLFGAAAVGGAFWGLLYMKLKRLDTLIICHSVWSAFIFAVLPLT
ncbi:MAG: CPBP family glutamic-type intramembrane protease [Deltaproteobacteria bacterium]|nr:CPBP family glutamic-type intramembrane protease [Deltaproteobacteria bacterium]